jgi:hypothetical protein
MYREGRGREPGWRDVQGSKSKRAWLERCTGNEEEESLVGEMYRELRGREPGWRDVQGRKRKRALLERCTEN